MMKTINGFEIQFAFLAYVPPFQDEAFQIETEVLKKHNKTTEYLFGIFDSAIDDAKVEILFDSDEKQQNKTREHILALGKGEKSLSNARQLARNLYHITDERNGTGLLSIIVGKKGNTTRVVLTRFKGDEGLVNHGKKLLIDYIAEIFTKKSKHYKLAVYEDIISDKSFWKGFSVDKQISANSYKSISFFWVEEFLKSKTALTPAQGTLQFSKVIKSMLQKAKEVEEQEEIISAIVNLRSKKNIQMSVADFCKNYLSEKVATRIREETNNDDFFNSVFQIDSEVYKKEFGKTVLSLQDGITAYVPTFQYAKHVTEIENLDGTKNVRIEGKLNGKKINVRGKEMQDKSKRPNKKK